MQWSRRLTLWKDAVALQETASEEEAQVRRSRHVNHWNDAVALQGMALGESWGRDLEAQVLRMGRLTGVSKLAQDQSQETGFLVELEQRDPNTARDWYQMQPKTFAWMLTSQILAHLWDVQDCLAVFSWQSLEMSCV
jgi:hypothetical protein